MAGMVAPTPKAMDSPADPAVWAMLFSSTVASRPPKNLAQSRNNVSEITATGMEALTVMPTLSIK
jgi:hypothetical protein